MSESTDAAVPSISPVRAGREAGALGVALALALAPAFVVSCDRPASAPPGAEHGADEHDDHDHEAHDEVTLSPEAIRSGIVIERAQRRVLEPSFTAPARVSFNLERMAHVGSPLRGRIVDLSVKLGQDVGEGGVLLVIESPELGEAQSDLLSKLAAAESSVPAVGIARSAFERAKALHDANQGIALTEVQKREAEYRSAEAAQRAAESAAQVAESRLRLLGMDEAANAALRSSQKIDPRAAIRAPIAGTVVEREVTLGELVGPDRDALLVIADMETLWILASVPESRLPEVSIGARVLVEMGLGEGERFEGVISYISPTTDASTRSSEVRIEVRHGHCALRPGSFARAEITAAPEGSTEPVLVVPDEAIQTIEGRAVVFVAVEGEEGTFVARPIERGTAVGEFVPVLDGLEEGERIVIRGSFVLKAELGKSGAEHVH
jgi:cobalt-zinc-cadmium efflux system membrane fusion protein